MGFLDRLFGRGRRPEQPRPAPARRGYAGGDPRGDADEQALARYRYLLRTAPPKAIEQTHQEAFARLTPAQRARVLQELSQHVPPEERDDRDDPRSLARMATRAELRRPGVLERSFGGMGMGGGLGFGGVLAGSLLGSIAGSVIGSAIANEFFDNDPDFLGGGLDQPFGDGNPLDAPGEAGGGDLLNAEEYTGGDLSQDFAGDQFAEADLGDGGDFGDGEM